MTRRLTNAFTLIEFLTTIAIIAVLVTGSLFLVSSYANWARQTSNLHTLTVLNDALTRYKTEGGNLSSLSAANTAGANLRLLATPCIWVGGLVHQFLNSNYSHIKANTLIGIGAGASYQFVEYNGTWLTAGGVFKDISAAANVTTYAGVGGSSGTTNGPRLSAKFNSPDGLILDGSGNLFVAESADIRKVDSSGNVTTLCSGLSTPKGMAWGPDGMLYVACYGNHAVYQVNPGTGTAMLFAGIAGSSGNTNSTALASTFNLPNCIAFDPSGNMYVGERGNSDIRKIDTGGNVTTLATFTSTMPLGLVYDSAASQLIMGAASSGQGLYLVDPSSGAFTKPLAAVFGTMAFNPTTRRAYGIGNNRIYVTDLSGGNYASLSSGSTGYQDGPLSSAQFNLSYGALAFDSSGNLFVADQSNNCIRLITNP